MRQRKNGAWFSVYDLYDCYWTLSLASPTFNAQIHVDRHGLLIIAELLQFVDSNKAHVDAGTTPCTLLMVDDYVDHFRLTLLGI